MPTLIVGEPGTNKSTMLIDYAARVTTGRRFPGEGAIARGPEPVIYLSAEASAAYTIKPRFLAAGGDPRQLHVLNVNADGFNLETGMPQLEAAIRETGAQHLLVDPINAFLPTTDSWKDTAIRSALRPLRDLAERMDIPVIAVMHLNKKTEQSGLNRINGSVGYGAMARAVYLVAVDPDDGSMRQFHCLKPSVMAKPAALRFSLTPTTVTDNGGDPINTVAITWDIQTPITTTTEELLRPARKPRKGSVEDGTDLVVKLMADGPMPAADLLDQLKEAGLTPSNAVRAMTKATTAEKAPGAKDSPWYRIPYGWDRAQFEAWWRAQSKERE
jgi:KaiC/GvpD/RAD55 family RecA-like ATPase